MSRSTPAAPVDDSRDAVRPLPPNPSLEFERKQAKALVRGLRRGDPDALSRAAAEHRTTPRSSASSPFTLADAQHIIAREYGFASWPRLVRYVRDFERDTSVGPAGRSQGYTPEHYDAIANSLLREHGRRYHWAGRTLAAFVPRLYGRSIHEVLDTTVTVDDARLAIARQNRCTSWAHLLEAAAATRRRNDSDIDPWTRATAPFMKAIRAMDAQDLPALRAIAGEYPDLIRPSEESEQEGHALVRNALIGERQKRTAESREITDWVVSHGLDLTGPLNRALLGFFTIKTVEVQYLLDRGADPAWMPANGISVLEHALVRYWNGEAVDLIARRVTPRRALWIAAGLGDVEGVQRYFDRSGKPTAAAFRDRPPLGLMSPRLMPALPEPDAAELLLETMLIAGLNGRAAVVEMLMRRGVPIDYLGWGGMSLLHLAAGNQQPSLVEALVRLGADLDLKGYRPNVTPRELACRRFETEPESAIARRVVELCGLDPERVLAAAAARRPSPPPLDPRAMLALELAGDDAARQRQSDIRPDNLLIGILRTPFPLPFLTTGGVDLDILRSAIGNRLIPADERVPRPKLPLAADVRAAVERAVALAAERHRGAVRGSHLLHGLLDNEASEGVRLLTSAGASLSRLRQELARL